MCRLFESILSTRSGDFTKCTKLHFLDEKLRTWTSCPGSWSQCLNSAWCLHGHPYINWVTNKELKNMEKDFVVILCLSASKVLSLVFLWGRFQCDDQILHSSLEFIWVNGIHMPRLMPSRLESHQISKYLEIASSPWLQWRLKQEARHMYKEQETMKRLGSKSSNVIYHFPLCCQYCW